MPSIHSSPFYKMEHSPALLSLLRRDSGERRSTTTTNTKTSSSRSTGSTSGGLLKMFKLFPMLTSGCKMVALLGGRSSRKPLLKDSATTTGTIFGYRKGRVYLAIQEDPHCVPLFVIELPMLTSSLQKEMASDIVRIALESETKTHKKKLMEEFVWGVYCNGRKMGYCIRRKEMGEDEIHVMKLLRGVSMGAGVLPCLNNNNNNNSNNNNNYDQKTSNGDGELTYMRARFDKVVGSKDSEALYMINPDDAQGPEFSIFFVRSH